MITETKPVRRKPGPIPGPPTRKYNIMIEEEIAEWGKRQAGGLSNLIRSLLREAMRQEADKTRS